LLDEVEQIDLARDVLEVPAEVSFVTSVTGRRDSQDLGVFVEVAERLQVAVR
jgi:hypothetical protein